MRTKMNFKLRRSGITADAAPTGLNLVRVDDATKISLLTELGKAGQA
jgi:hypothetical protein